MNPERGVPCVSRVSTGPRVSAGPLGQTGEKKRDPLGRPEGRSVMRSRDWPQYPLTILLALLVAAAFWQPATARAAPSEDLAKEEFNAGRAAYEREQYAEAVEHFLAAEHIRPAPQLDYNIGLAYEALHETAMALRYYRQFLAKAPHAVNREEVEDRISALVASRARPRPEPLQQLTAKAQFSARRPGDTYTVTATTGQRCQVPCTLVLSPGSTDIVVRGDGYFQENVLVPPSGAFFQVEHCRGFRRNSGAAMITIGALSVLAGILTFALATPASSVGTEQPTTNTGAQAAGGLLLGVGVGALVGGAILVGGAGHDRLHLMEGPVGD